MVFIWNLINLGPAILGWNLSRLVSTFLYYKIIKLRFLLSLSGSHNAILSWGTIWWLGFFLEFFLFFSLLDFKRKFFELLANKSRNVCQNSHLLFQEKFLTKNFCMKIHRFKNVFGFWLIFLLEFLARTFRRNYRLFFECPEDQFEEF